MGSRGRKRLFVSRLQSLASGGLIQSAVTGVKLSAATALESFFIGTQTNVPAFWKHSFNFIMGSRDNMDADQLADPSGGRGPCIGRCFHRSDIAPDENSYVTRTDVLFTDQLDISGFHHCVRCLYCTNETFRFYHAERF
jgi:hypothetical protein